VEKGEHALLFLLELSELFTRPAESAPLILERDDEGDDDQHTYYEEDECGIVHLVGSECVRCAPARFLARTPFRSLLRFLLQVFLQLSDDVGEDQGVFLVGLREDLM
jgi:ribosomal protein S27AE